MTKKLIIGIISTVVGVGGITVGVVAYNMHQNNVAQEAMAIQQEEEAQKEAERLEQERLDKLTEEATEAPVEEPASQFTFTDLSQTKYAINSLNVRDLPSTDGTKLGGLSKAQEVTVTGQCNETGRYRITYNGGEAFVSNSYLVDDKPVATQPAENPYPLYTEIDDGGDNVYFYFLSDGIAAKSSEYWTCQDQCVDILNQQKGLTGEEEGWYAGANASETKYYVDGKRVVKVLPLVSIYTG